MTAADAPAFEWDGKPRETLGTLLIAAMEAEQAGKAAEFLAAYRAYTPHADSNLGYLIGYVEPPELRHELYQAYAIGHPIFGGAL